MDEGFLKMLRASARPAPALPKYSPKRECNVSLPSLSSDGLLSGHIESLRDSSRSWRRKEHALSQIVSATCSYVGSGFEEVRRLDSKCWRQTRAWTGAGRLHWSMTRRGRKVRLGQFCIMQRDRPSSVSLPRLCDASRRFSDRGCTF